ncbi:methionine-rich copper-binding protein CopC [Microbacterium marinum]|uniref:Methionine-rich copper-binding protein CopC n=1 Tax=Microbacterium marinum TaxID=421115 RepID=A0A7W7FJW8_9MICO|nr:copper resistance CopC family protein [Microbacterium marinum]MBB4667835.1 methionine-rich copper-binding protein CopC [Microbacterium marinum]
MRHTHLFSGAAAAVLAALLITASSAPAIAHESLTSSSPTEGQQFDTAPQQVELVFTDEVLPQGAEIAVVDDAGEDWVDGEVTIDGSAVTVPLAADMPDAGYEVQWRVVSGDGHPISSTIPFTVGDAEPVSEAHDDGHTSHADAEAEESDQSAGLPTWGVVTLAVGGVVVAAGVAFLAVTLARRRRS